MSDKPSRDHQVDNSSPPPRTLKSRTIDAVADLIKDGKATRIVAIAGAGISTSAGIPDFRSPDTGIYSRLDRLNLDFKLPYPEAVFDISYFRHTPEPFYALARARYPDLQNYKPTVTHAFLALLASKGLLHTLITQNIDTLEHRAGVPKDKIIAAHGSIATQRCLDCKTPFDDDAMRMAVLNGEVPHCREPQCNGIIRPDTVFFGEELPERYHAEAPKAVSQDADLVIIMGTSLTVHPVAGLPRLVKEGVPRVLVNLTKAGDIGNRPDDVCVIGESCDEGVRRLADALGWREELEALWRDVGGGEEDGEVKEEKEEASSTKKDGLNILKGDEEVTKLASKMDRRLRISNGHKNWLEKHLEKKLAGPPKPANPIDQEISVLDHKE
ncbi:hypothetical protein VTN00DRAFT_3005 [Thermoascus crustaceus]|uniref:uncharacterized protein n=1 Tax=Thermoascus crustaceus TaxID=5088 RepID=UPI003743E0F3